MKAEALSKMSQIVARIKCQAEQAQEKFDVGAEKLRINWSVLRRMGKPISVLSSNNILKYKKDCFFVLPMEEFMSTVARNLLSTAITSNNHRKLAGFC